MAEHPYRVIACENACATDDASLPPWLNAFAAASAYASLAEPPSAAQDTVSASITTGKIFK